MKPLLLVLALLPFSSLANIPCGNGASWTNPDGTKGGFVASTSKVEKGVYVGPHARVCNSAQVKGSAKILDTATISGGATVEGDAIISGNSKVYWRAHVKQGSKVHNSIVCQASVIKGIEVKDSDYYCQTEDPVPRHPGEEGNKTLLGIDSDNDGVRDDVEIWINERFSNTPTLDLYNYRMALKQYT